jgi:hypothetical protein
MRTRWKLVGGAGLVGVGLALFTLVGHSRVSRGDTTTMSSTTNLVATAPAGTGVPATPEPITDTPAVSATGWESTPKDPFQPFDIGPGTHWSYNDLSAAEKARVDAGRDTTGWDKVNNVYANASAELAHRAATQSAAIQLGITDTYSTLGVVP